MLASFLRALGRTVHRSRWWVIALWIVGVAVAAMGSSQVQKVLLGGSGAIKGSQSLAVDGVLYRDFDNPYTKSFQVTFDSQTLTLDDPAFSKVVGDAEASLKRIPKVRGVLSFHETHDTHLRSPDGHAMALVVGIQATSVQEEESILPAIRKTLEPLKGGPVRILVTGRSAITTDVNLFNAGDSSRAEGRAIPLTLIVLVVAFGSLLAAGIPLGMGMVSTMVSLGVLYVLGQHMELSNLSQNVSTMLGLAVGIDYSLLMVNRFRESLAAGMVVEDAIAETLATAGQAVIYSGLTVIIGLAGLFFSPLLETQSVGLGGCIVVASSVVACLTLVPAVFSLVGHTINWPKALSRNLVRPESVNGWRRWAQFVMARPGRSIGLVVVVVAAMLYPMRHYVAGFPDQKWLPQGMEARQGIDVLKTMKLGWSVFPIYVVVTAPEGETPLSTQHVGGLIKLSQALHQEKLVTLVYSPVDLQAGMSPLTYAMLYSNLGRATTTYPAIKELFLSHDKRSVLYQVILGDETPLAGAKVLANRIGSWDLGGGLKVAVGGQPVYYNDFDHAMDTSIPMVVGFVLVATFLVLAIAFRSLLIPLKAILMNLMSVGAGYGAMVAVFLKGWGGWLVGMHEPATAIPQSIMLIIFCVVFGLSMDYEVFLLSRIKEAYDASGDNDAATADGLAFTGGIITSAALIMAVIFGAFAWAEMVLVKMMGLGLAVAVLVDATLIRCVAVPAFMRWAGRWNWYPGARIPTSGRMSDKEPAGTV